MDAQQKAEILNVLEAGTLELDGLLPWSSNYAFLGRVCGEALELPVVYKPQRGERPLWDFPQGTLCLREQAAFLVSDALGWDIVPPTVLRSGQHGRGTVQLFIDHDPERHYFTIEGSINFASQLQQIVLFDIVINNADRKGGHILIEQTGKIGLSIQPGRLWGIDHGICFHEDKKLRTVIWEFAGSPISEDQMQALRTIQIRLNQTKDGFNTQMRTLLTRLEMDALLTRLERLLRQKNYPQPGPGRHYPWPPV